MLAHKRVSGPPGPPAVAGPGAGPPAGRRERGAHPPSARIIAATFSRKWRWRRPT